MPRRQALERLAVELRVQGFRVDEIAVTLGLSLRATYKLLERAWQKLPPLEDYRQVELARCEAVLRRYWESALGGDLAAARLVLDLIELEAKIAGLLSTREEPGDLGKEILAHLAQVKERLRAEGAEPPALADGARDHRPGAG
ncbi:MAG: hypothetical protein NZ761_06205 [Dehalococcoidia bacterium]|nr:hypothetical protein [Dehalococcoidia bacterium]